MARKVQELTYREVLERMRGARSFDEGAYPLLPARGPKGSAQNRVRMRTMQRALRAWSELGREGT